MMRWLGKRHIVSKQHSSKLAGTISFRRLLSEAIYFLIHIFAYPGFLILNNGFSSTLNPWGDSSCLRIVCVGRLRHPPSRSGYWTDERDSFSHRQRTLARCRSRRQPLHDLVHLEHGQPPVPALGHVRAHPEQRRWRPGGQSRGARSGETAEGHPRAGNRDVSERPWDLRGENVCVSGNMNLCAMSTNIRGKVVVKTNLLCVETHRSWNCA